MQITISKQTAKDLKTAIHFLAVGCSKGTLDKPEDRKLSTKNLKVFGLTPNRLLGVVKLIGVIDKQLSAKK